VILTDAGPLIAILDRGEGHHGICVDCLSRFTGPMVTTWPAFTEAMYLLGEAGGPRGQEALWALVKQEDLKIVPQDAIQMDRIAHLMRKYRDLPMDLAGASLVVLAEDLKVQEIFTLDRNDFTTYRIGGRKSFRIWPPRPGT